MKWKMIYCCAVIAVVLLSAPPVAADSPIDPGAFTVGGSLRYSGFFDDDTDIYTILLMPEFQYFIYPGLALGADGFLDYWHYPDRSEMRYGIGPSIAYYLKLENLSGFPFAKAAVMYSHVEIEKYFFSRAENDIRANISLGYTYILAKNIAIVGAVDYTYERAFLLDFTLDSEWREVFGFSVGLKAFIY
ncbi:MAG: hypothetical protein GF310_11440 [candidate division Zixibacteria bacterium]|nr:hypothetical protein [candidate division Zixibacteria bacterium]